MPIRMFRKRRAWAAVTTSALASAGLTAAAIFLLDPGNRRRRHVAFDKVKHMKHAAASELDRARRDLRYRARGMAARRREHEHADDDTLNQRARAALGHVCSHPHAIETHVADGVLHLTGHVLSEERRHIAREMRHVIGIADVVDELVEHRDPGNVPSLQGGRHRERRHMIQATWAPGTRLLAGAAGAGLIGATFGRGRALGLAGGVAGGFLLARALMKADARVLRGPFKAKKTIFIAAHIDEVFALFGKVEQFPRFMTHVKDVHRIDSDNYVWRVDGPFGPLTATCMITRWLPREAISWKSIDDGPVRMDGHVRFYEEGTGTRIDVELSYTPPAGRVGHRVAKAFHRDPKHLLDDDLLRLKSLLEDGKATGRGEQVTLADLRTHRGEAE